MVTAVAESTRTDGLDSLDHNDERATQVARSSYLKDWPDSDNYAAYSQHT